jgi:hypothetical protein
MAAPEPEHKQFALKPGCTDEEAGEVVAALQKAGVHGSVKGAAFTTMLAEAESLLWSAAKQYGPGVIEALAMLVKNQLVVSLAEPAPH